MMSSFFDGKIVTVSGVTQEMLDWLEESDIKYHITPHLERWKYSGCFGGDQSLPLRGVERESDYRQTGDDIMFEKEEDRMHFQLRWAEYIKTGDDPWLSQ